MAPAGRHVARLTDRDAIAAWYRRAPLRHVYALGDLDDFFWPHTEWPALVAGGEVEQVALIYREPDPPVLLAIPEPPVSAMEGLLDALLPELPPRVYAHVDERSVPVLERRYEVRPHGLHLKLGLVDAAAVRAEHSPERPVWLDSSDLPEIETLYAEAYPGTWFTPRMLETGRYAGLRVDGTLACIAGVHVWSPGLGVAALGNVATLPAQRGRGLARALCAALCRRLLDEDGITAIALNVRADNAPALAAYRRLGFEPVAEYLEASLEER